MKDKFFNVGLVLLLILCWITITNAEPEDPSADNMHSNTTAKTKSATTLSPKRSTISSNSTRRLSRRKIEALLKAASSTTEKPSMAPKGFVNWPCGMPPLLWIISVISLIIVLMVISFALCASDTVGGTDKECECGRLCQCCQIHSEDDFDRFDIENRNKFLSIPRHSTDSS